MKQIGRKRRHRSIARKIKGVEARPRLVVFRSKKHIYAQIVNDAAQTVIAGCSTLSKEFGKDKSTNVEAAKKVGKMIAGRAMSLGLKIVSFDRCGYKYHGRVKNLADGAREGGLKF